MKLCVLALLFVAHTSCQANGKRTQQEPADSTLNSQHSTLNAQHSSLNSQPSTLISHLSTLNSQLSTLNSQLSTLNAQPSTLNLIIAGDLMQHGPQIKAAFERGQNQARLNTTDYKTGNGTYNYDECFASVKDEIERADVAIANFEVTLGGRPYKGYPQFSAPDEYLKACIDAGFDILLTANNHCLDSYQRGLERTIHMMDSLGVPHIGTYRNAEERKADYPFLLEQNGLRVALLNFTYGTNGLKVKEPNVVNYMDTTEIARDIV
ncbi:MAG: CapA family protein, partial [Prevotella sp.]|nr:CapA family protein [Prevotella sp.]